MIRYSASESEVTGFRIGRGELSGLPAAEIIRATLADGYDILRLKINASQSDIFEFLETLGMPYQVNSILLRNSIMLDDTIAAVPENATSPFYFEELGPGNEHLIDEIFSESVSAETGQVYPSWIQATLVDKDLLQRAAVAYARSFATGTEGKKGWLIKQGDTYIGYNLGRLDGSVFEGILIGVRPEYRNSGAASQVYRYFISHVFPAMGVTHFYNDVQIQNTPSLKSTFKGKVAPSASLLNVNLFPLLSYQTGHVLPVTLRERAETSVYAESPDIYTTIKEMQLGHPSSKDSMSCKAPEDIKDERHHLSRAIYYDASGLITGARYSLRHLRV